MTTKNICPATLAEGYDGYSPIAIKYLFNGHKATPEITFPWPEERESVPAMLVRGNMRICRRQQQPGYVLEKFVSGPHNERIPIAANKHLTMQIASQVFHIQTIQNGLCFTRDGEPLFVTQYGQTKSYRGRKVKDVATIMNISEDQPLYSSISWQEVASVIRQIAPAWPVALERFFVTLVFNYIYCNESCGLRSIALYEPHPGDYQIAPARHLVNTAIIPALPSEETHDFALQFEKSGYYEETGHPCHEDFMRFALLIGLREERAERLLKPFTTLPEDVLTLVDNSFLSDKEKEDYKQQISYRTQLFNGTYHPIEALTEDLTEAEERQYEDLGILPEEQTEETEPQPQEESLGLFPDEEKEEPEEEKDTSSLTYGSLFDF